MTEKQFLSLKVGDRVEFLDVHLNRTGKIVTIERKTRSLTFPGIRFRWNAVKSGWVTVTNPVRVEFPEES